jgi:hypothetical protein
MRGRGRSPAVFTHLTIDHERKGQVTSLCIHERKRQVTSLCIHERKRQVTSLPLPTLAAFMRGRSYHQPPFTNLSSIHGRNGQVTIYPLPNLAAFMRGIGRSPDSHY